MNAAKIGDLVTIASPDILEDRSVRAFTGIAAITYRAILFDAHSVPVGIVVNCGSRSAGSDTYQWPMAYVVWSSSSAFWVYTIALDLIERKT